jgi:broad specificity phosphatase PhoE
LLEVRRHSLLKPASTRGLGSQLSAEGVALARSIGGEISFGHVRTSTSPRTIETAIAMGYAVDEAIEMPSGYVPGEVDHHDQWEWPQPYARYAELIRVPGALSRVATELALLWVGALRRVPDGGAALVVGHGGGIEPALVTCLPNADYASWGKPFRPCDGARLTHDGERFTSVEFLRAPTS